MKCFGMKDAVKMHCTAIKLVLLVMALGQLFETRGDPNKITPPHLRMQGWIFCLSLGRCKDLFMVGGERHFSCNNLGKRTFQG